jgi:hypothetical protein
LSACRNRLERFDDEDSFFADFEFGCAECRRVQKVIHVEGESQGIDPSQSECQENAARKADGEESREAGDTGKLEKTTPKKAPSRQKLLK